MQENSGLKKWAPFFWRCSTSTDYEEVEHWGLGKEY